MRVKDKLGNNSLMKSMLYLFSIVTFQLLLLITFAYANSDSWDYPVSPYTPGSYAGRTFYVDGNHLGEDEDLSEGTPVRSIGAGYIKKYGSATGYGELVVVIEHDLGQDYTFANAYGTQVTTRYILSIYGHLRKSEYRDGSPLNLGEGQWVDKGAVIGYVNDDTNNGDGAEHLHMGIRLSNAAKAIANDPSAWYRGYEYSSEMGRDFAAASAVLSILKHEDVEVYEFWQKEFSPGTDGYLVDCLGGNNFDAQFKLENNSSYTIQSVALAAHYSNGNYRSDLRKDSVTIPPGQPPYHFKIAYARFQDAGDYQIIAKAYYNNKWHHLATKFIKILPNSSCSTSGKATLKEPSGTITTTNPSYKWIPATGTPNWYYIYVYQYSIKGPLIRGWFPASSMGCSSGICTLSVTQQLTPGNYAWTVIPYSYTGGLGKWSSWMYFKVQ